MKSAFKKRRLQIISWIVAITMLATQLGTSTVSYASTVDANSIANTTTNEENDGSDPSSGNTETPDELKPTTEESSSSQITTATTTAPTNTSTKSIGEILVIAATDGGQAANLLNAYSDLELFEDGVRQILDLYYSGDSNNQLTSFVSNIDQRADEIVKNYKEAALERSKEGELNYVPGEVIVVFEEDANTEEASEELEETQDATIQMIEPQEATVDENEIAVAEISLEQTVEDAIEELEKEADVAYVQPNYIYSLPDDDFSTASASTTAVTNDAGYSEQWYLNNIYASQAWDFLNKCSRTKIRIAVLDTGVKADHPDLQAVLNKNLCVDATTIALAKSTTDNIGHGTHVAGIIGGTSNNNIGITGVATGASNSYLDLMVVDVFTGSGKDAGADTASLVRGLDYAQKQGAKIINMSLGLYYNDPALQNKINSVSNAGTLIICAAGNDNLILPFYPSDLSSVISVIATDQSNQRADFSNYGEDKDISAPGVDILSTWEPSVYPYDSYAYCDGTSMACPVVVGVAAMALSVKPTLTPAKMKSLLYSTATDVTSYGAGWDANTGYGVVNAYKAVASAANASVSTGVTTTGATINCGTSKKLTATLTPSYSLDSVTWTSSNPSVVSVNSTTGVVTGNKVGSAVITATTGYGKKATCTVTVNLAKPAIALKSTSYKSVTLTWSNIPGATKYMLYRSTSKNGKYKLITTTTSRIFADKKLKLGTKYYYKVKAIGVNGSITKVNLSSVFRTTPKVAKVSTMRASALSKTQIKLTWKKVAGATNYKIYRATSKNGSYKLLGTTSSTKYYSKSLKSKKTYYYKIVAVRTYKEKNYKSSYSSVISCKTK